MELVNTAIDFNDLLFMFSILLRLIVQGLVGDLDHSASCPLSFSAFGGCQVFIFSKSGT